MGAVQVLYFKSPDTTGFTEDPPGRVTHSRLYVLPPRPGRRGPPGVLLTFTLLSGPDVTTPRSRLICGGG
ncbi:Testis-Expressed Basic Protein 1 [Manis pentadactyla]|nr:Testis-Expressed Basic Protein 1 [Manis pentadactyla]